MNLVLGKMLLEAANTLLAKSRWTKEDVMPIVKLLYGRVCVDGRGDNLEGANAYARLTTKLNKFLLKHKDLRRMLL